MKRASGNRPSRAGKPGTIRIIAGQWRGRKLPVHDAEGLRPTTDRNKETLFNWLMHDLRDARCLDLFAGSGGLGFEALSRFAASCTFVEKNKTALQQLASNSALLSAHSTLIQGDALTVIEGLNETFDIVFIDPPFNHNLVQPAIDALWHHRCVSPGAKMYVEQEANAPAINWPEGTQILKEKRLPQLYYCLVQLP